MDLGSFLSSHFNTEKALDKGARSSRRFTFPTIVESSSGGEHSTITPKLPRVPGRQSIATWENTFRGTGNLEKRRSGGTDQENNPKTLRWNGSLSCNHLGARRTLPWDV